MAKFNFKKQLKNKSLEWLKEFREETLNTMLLLSSSGHKDSSKYNRYLSYIDDEINKK
jgi:hypothetical protein